MSLLGARHSSGALPRRGCTAWAALECRAPSHERSWCRGRATPWRVLSLVATPHERHGVAHPQRRVSERKSHAPLPPAGERNPIAERYAGSASPPRARRRAARASRRVESSVGRGELASLMISGISVQPSTTASQPASFSRADDLLEVGDRLRLEDAAHQLVHDDAVALARARPPRAHASRGRGRRASRDRRSLSTSQRVPVRPSRRKPRARGVAAATTSAMCSQGSGERGSRAAAPGGWCCRGRSGSRRRCAASLRAESSISSPTPAQSPRSRHAT